MGEAKRRKQLGRNYGFGHNRGLSVAMPTIVPVVGYESWPIDRQVRAKLGEMAHGYDHCLLVSVQNDGEEVSALVLFSYKANVDKLGIDSRTGRKHYEDYHLTSCLCVFGQSASPAPAWVGSFVADRGDGTAAASAQTMAIAKQSIRLLESA